jgi:hypothetical protein
LVAQAVSPAPGVSTFSTSFVLIPVDRSSVEAVVAPEMSLFMLRSY